MDIKIIVNSSCYGEPQAPYIVAIGELDETLHSALVQDVQNLVQAVPSDTAVDSAPGTSFPVFSDAYAEYMDPDTMSVAVETVGFFQGADINSAQSCTFADLCTALGLVEPAGGEFNEDEFEFDEQDLTGAEVQEFIDVSTVSLEQMVSDPERYQPGKFDLLLWNIYQSDTKNFGFLNANPGPSSLRNTLISIGLHTSNNGKPNATVVNIMTNDALRKTIPASRLLSNGYCVSVDYSSEVTTVGDIHDGTQLMLWFFYKLCKKAGKTQLSTEELIGAIQSKLSCCGGNESKLFDTLFLLFKGEDENIGDVILEDNENVPAPREFTPPINQAYAFKSDAIKTACKSTIDYLRTFYEQLFKFSFKGIIAKGPDGSVSAWRITDGNLVKLTETVHGDATADTLITNIAGNAGLISNSWALMSIDNALGAPAENMVEFLLSSKINYIPEFHVAVLSGVLPDRSVSLKLSDHVGNIKERVTALYRQLDLKYGSSTNLKEVSDAIAQVRNALLSICVVADYKPYLKTFLTTFRYDAMKNSINNTSVVGMENQDVADASKTILTHNSAPYPNLELLYFCTDADTYKKEVNFGYKALEFLEARGVRSSFSNVIIGRNVDNGLPVELDFSLKTRFCTTIYAGSRSGKGVLTLCTLGTALATGHPFAYFDNKPDMAGVLWGIEVHDFGSKYKFLVVDANFDKDYTIKETSPTYIPERITIARSRSRATFNASMKKYGLEQIDYTHFAKVALFSKYTQILILINKLGGSFGVNDKFFAVLDETNGLSSSFKPLKDSLDIVAKRIHSLRALVKKGEKEHSPEEIQSAKEQINQLCTLLHALNFTPPVGGQQTIKDTPDDLTRLVDDFLDVSGGASGRLLVTCIGQRATALSPFFAWRRAVCAPGTAKIYGNDNGVPDAKNPEKITQFPTGSVGTGRFMVSAKDNKFDVCCNTYLTLNENDILFVKNGQSRVYYGDKEPRPFSSPFEDLAELWVDGVVDGTPEPRVGFFGYLQQIAHTNGMNLDDIGAAMGKGYEIITNILSNLLKKHNYSCIEDWLYDMSFESFYKYQDLSDLCTGIENSDPDTANMLADNDTDDISGMPTQPVFNPDDAPYTASDGHVADTSERDAIKKALDGCKFIWDAYFDDPKCKESYLAHPSDKVNEINALMDVTNTALNNVDSITGGREYPIFGDINTYIDNILYSKSQWEAEARRMGVLE